VSIKPGIGYDFAKPTKVYAATACGVPAIFAGRGAGNELVETERLGWSVDHDETAVAAAMAEALTGPGWPTAERERIVAWTREHASLAAVSRLAAAELLRL
jgi:glycosyltransferase involved in cell wall biosynthesis